MIGFRGKDSRGAEGVLERNEVKRKNEATAEPRIACFWQVCEAGLPKAALINKKI